ncbi:conserved hypothetical protein [Pyrenophora tritici-repentis Pt-1C-BFP]|uniref:Rhodanese domain-containing protein n=1 Tax=Pyrenophora tritici-repentis (strain Pt-1C-BFP) TaxID=426418 RepID=B2WJS8_PYRTR|nr:uncharacterized protein PTRG_10425 [Pyrenophora tritici-repentis Pt-1C-BFP]EDU43475.1 conserved hypothetical protein [Pyrenophora tritici-repentis Pt-1C-BFP]
MSSKHFLKLLGSTPRSQTSVIGRQPDLLSRIVGSQAHFHPSPRSLRSSPSSTENKLYEFDDVLHILEHPSDSRLLIDVREPHEYDANNIPTAINIPVTSHPDALLLPEEEFGEQFGFEKPPRGKEVVFFCKAGVRSRAAAGIARQAGGPTANAFFNRYVNVGEYRGSWLDWQKRGGPGTKPTARTGSSGEENLGPDGKPEYPPGGLMGTKQ